MAARLPDYSFKRIARRLAVLSRIGQQQPLNSSRRRSKPLLQLAGLLALAGCGARYAEGLRVQPTMAKLEITNSEQCLARNGSWVRAGEAQLDQCDSPTLDAGKACRNSHEFQTVCAAPMEATIGSMVTGVCYRSTLLAGRCLNLVGSGRVLGQTCWD